MTLEERIKQRNGTLNTVLMRGKFLGLIREMIHYDQGVEIF